jgi:hypothetical protein
MKTSYSRSGSSHLGERGKRVKKVKPMSQAQLKTLRELNLKIEQCQQLSDDYLNRKNQLIAEKENYLKNRLI